jgi:signal transduction histidine kinase
LNTYSKRILIALAFIFAGAGALVFNLLYQEAKATAISKLNEEQMIHARQASRGIEDFFASWTRNLSALAKTDEIVNNDAIGQRTLKWFYEANQEQVLAITRLDEHGVIRYNFPQNDSVGMDLSRQPHVRELLRDHQPVVSDVFKSVEGLDAVALHVPVFKESEFKGSVGILINFQSLANRYLDVIKIGKTGYAWVISRDGTILYTPVTGFAGKSVFAIIKDSPSLKVVVDQMLQGRQGVAQYTFDRIGDQTVGPTTKYAVYMPVLAGNTFWSVAVVSAEQDVLSGLNTFRNKLFIVIAAFFILGMVFSTLGAKAWLIVKEEEKRQQAEAHLRESEVQLHQQRKELAHLSRVTMLGELSGSMAHELNQPLTAILSNAQAAQRFLARDDADLNEVRDILQDIVEQDQRAGEIIRRLRLLLKKGVVQQLPLDLNDVVQEVLKLIRSDLVNQSIAVQTVLAPDLPPVKGDRVQLQQVLLNLVMNACDAMTGNPSAERRLTVRTERCADGSVRVSVSDCGTGVAPEKLDQIFEPFYSTKPHGLGLGLSVCRTIIGAHGGKLWAVNDPARGAVFYFTIPALKEKSL